MPEQATLLVADDDAAVRLSLERTLTREGYGVVLAPDGQAALDRLRQGGVDLLLSDLKMPGLTGLELLKLAKEVAPDLGKRLFEQFFTTKPQGTGLGLYISRQIIEQHGGTLRWESAPGAGTIFTASLPIKRAEHA